MRYLSVCSGIEAASVAWHPLGWSAVAYAEIEPFPSAVLAHHYPSVPNWGDLTKFKDWPDADVDVLVGGTPCQSFSVAGLRKGLADPRGNLALTYLAVADKYRPEWLVWENVPGVLSSGGGRDFGAFLGALGVLWYGWAYRVLDAQYFGLAQRRKRVFIVASSRGWQRAAAVLFDSASLRGDPPPSREAREGTSGGAVAGTLDSRHAGGFQSAQAAAAAAHLVPSLRADGFDASEDGTGRGTPLVPIAFSVKDHGADATDGHSMAVALNFRGREGGTQAELGDEVATALRCGGGTSSKSHAMVGMQVRRLTPRECARLQGFPDDYLDIIYRGKPAADGPKYKALGNSMAVPVMAWIGRRIQLVSEIEG